MAWITRMFYSWRFYRSWVSPTRNEMQFSIHVTESQLEGVSLIYFRHTPLQILVSSGEREALTALRR